jgi:small subunit ribosomal protein S13
MVLIINKTKSIKKSLKFNYGVGTQHALTICKNIGLNLRKNCKKIKKKIKIKLFKRYKILDVNFILKQKKKKILYYSRDLKTYKSLRNRKGLPARGQRTQTNGQTKKKLRF